MQQTSAPSDSSADRPGIDLDFPTLPVQGTPARWLPRSLLINMASHQHDDSSCDETTSSLGDSAYDFIDDRSVITTDDEEQDAMTASTTSSDGNEIDQLHPRRLGIVTQTTSENQPVLPSQTRGVRQRLCSPPPEITGRSSGNPTHAEEPIEFDEPSITNLNSYRVTDVGYTLTTVDSHDLFGARYPQSTLNVTLRQSMTSTPLDLAGRSYKVLFVGGMAFKDNVTQKIATALAASPRAPSSKSGSPHASKFNVVPISSFGDETNPEVVLIDSSGLELSVEQCMQATFIETPGGNDILQMTLADDVVVRSSWNGLSFVLSDDWILPDIAVFCTSEDDDFRVKRTRRFARSFMNRHDVQSIIISEEPQWEKNTNALTLDTFTPHMCLESADTSGLRPRVLKRVPIDLNTFLRIDAGQLNRNLACLAKARSDVITSNEELGTRTLEHESKPHEGGDSIDLLMARCPQWMQAYYSFVKSIVDLPLAWSVVGLLIVSIGFTRLAMYASSGIYANTVSLRSATALTVPTTSMSVRPMLTSTSTSLVPTSSCTSSVLAQVSPIKSSSKGTDLAAFLLDDSARTPNKSETFKVYVLGDCHIVMRPPHWFTKLKKTPSPQFKISRRDSTLEHKVSNLFDGVYALQIPREEAYGLLDINIWTDSRPIINETFEVDFGSSWLKIAGWKRATRALSESVQMELSQVQTSLSDIYDRTKTEITTMVQKHSKPFDRQKGLDQAVSGHHYRLGLKTRDLVVAQTKDITRHLSRRLHNGSSVASAQAKAISKGATKQLARYARNRTAVISHQARVLRRAAGGIDIKRLFHGFRDSRRNTIRDTQKMLLKSWWRIRGLPKHKVGCKGQSVDVTRHETEIAGAA